MTARKARGPKRERIVVSATLPPEVVAWLDEKAAGQFATRSRALEAILREAMARARKRGA